MKKKLLLGISGSIAAHKTTTLVEKLAVDFEVQVFITKSAAQFVSPLTLEILSKNNVYIDVFDSEGTSVTHVKEAEECDLFIVAPASANTIGKMAGGIADNMLTCALMVADPKKVILCPAMNDNMFLNKRVQNNIEVLKQDGVRIIDPIPCLLASGKEGVGGLATNEQIIDVISKELKHL